MTIFIKAKKVAELLGYDSVSTVYKKAKLGDIPSYRPTGAVRFREDEILDLLEQSRVTYTLPSGNIRVKKPIRKPDKYITNNSIDATLERLKTI